MGYHVLVKKNCHWEMLEITSKSAHKFSRRNRFGKHKKIATLVMNIRNKLISMI